MRGGGSFKVGFLKKKAGVVDFISGEVGKDNNTKFSKSKLSFEGVDNEILMWKWKWKSFQKDNSNFWRKHSPSKSHQFFNSLLMISFEECKWLFKTHIYVFDERWFIKLPINILIPQYHDIKWSMGMYPDFVGNVS